MIAGLRRFLLLRLAADRGRRQRRRTAEQPLEERGTGIVAGEADAGRQARPGRTRIARLGMRNHVFQIPGPAEDLLFES